MYFSQNEKQRSLCELTLLAMKAKAFDINTPAGVCFALTKKPQDINSERWIAMIKSVMNNET